MNLRDLEYLVAVADHRHFGRAAEACFVSQPTLSTQLKKLEAELGAKLIERTPRQIMLTAAGESVVAKARTMLADSAEIRGIARQASDPRAGSLRLGAFPTLAPYLLPHVVAPLAESFPNLELLLVEEKSEELLDQLRTGRLDCALLAQPVHDESLHLEPLFVEDFVLAVPAGHPLSTDDAPLSPDVLDHEQLLLLTEGHCLRDQALDVCRLAGAAERSGFQATSLETLRYMVAGGVGMTLLPALAVEPPVPASPGIVLREFADPAPSRSVALVWRPSSVYAELLPEIAATLRGLRVGRVRPLAPAG